MDTRPGTISDPNGSGGGVEHPAAAALAADGLPSPSRDDPQLRRKGRVNRLSMKPYASDRGYENMRNVTLKTVACVLLYPLADFQSSDGSALLSYN